MYLDLRVPPEEPEGCTQRGGWFYPNSRGPTQRAWGLYLKNPPPVKLGCRSCTDKYLVRGQNLKLTGRDNKPMEGFLLDLMLCLRIGVQNERVEGMSKMWHFLWQKSNICSVCGNRVRSYQQGAQKVFPFNWKRRLFLFFWQKNSFVRAAQGRECTFFAFEESRHQCTQSRSL